MTQTLRRNLSLFLAAVALFSAVSVRAGEKPPYKVLQMKPCADIQPSPATPYAYGWFGAASRTHPVRQTGYYSLYTQWSWR